MSIGQKKFSPGELVTEIIIPDTPPQKKKYQKPQQQYEQEQVEKPANVKRSYNFEPYLYGELNKSQKPLSYLQKNLIQQQMNLLETKVHDIEGGQGQEAALRNIYKNSVSDNQFIDDVHISNKKGIKNVVNRVSQNVAGGLTEKMKPIRQVPRTKDDIKQLEKVDKYRMLKIKNGEIKNKIGDLRSELEHEYYVKKASYKLPDYQNVKQTDYYSIEHPRTQLANQFVHKIQQQRNEERERYKQYLQQKREEIEIKKEIEMQKKKAEAQQRRIKLQEAYQQKKMKKRMELEELEKKKQQYKKWSEMYSHQRLYKRMQEKQKIDKKLESRYYKDCLLEIKLERKPIDIDELNDHEERYLDSKRDKSITNQASLQLQKDMKGKMEQYIGQLYKGKYRYLVLEDMINQKMKYQEDPREQQRITKARQIVYGDEIKDRLFQQIKLKEQSQNLQQKQFTKRKRNIDGSTSLELNDQAKMTSLTDPKADGKKNLQFMKQLVREKGVKKDRPIIKLIQQKHVYPDYLEQIHEKRKRRNSNYHSSPIQQQSVDFTHGSPQIKEMIARQKNLNDKVKRGQLRKKYNSLDFEEDASVQDNEIDAVKLKLKLIQGLN